MSSAPATEAPRPARTPFFRWLHTGENWLVTLALVAMVLLPLTEALGRWLMRFNLHWSVPGAIDLTRHLTLVVGMIGGMIAAREARLLSLSTLTTFLRGRWLSFAKVFGSAAAIAVTGYLAIASAQYVRLELEFPQEIIRGVPRWGIELLMPIGFAVVACRLGWHAGATWRGRLVAGILGAAIMALLHDCPLNEGVIVL